MVKRKIVRIDEEKCDGCGLCVPACEEGAIQIVDGKARLLDDKLCDGLGDCLGECPQGAIEIIEREADEFDEEAVKERLKELKSEQQAKTEATAGGCPGSRMMQMQNGGGCPSSRPQSNPGKAKEQKETGSEEDECQAVSQLTQWPVQLHLVSPHAPYFDGSDLLIAADCVPFAYPEFHNNLLKDKSVAIGCPKLDDGNSYVEKLAQIFTVNDINSVTVAIMEVPCCSGMLSIVKKALELSEQNIPLEQVVIGVQGDKK
ncbi:ATP-binding protein [Natranaerobius thermophilus]|uniref:4Fe-4S ferredoxin iron-sulfur binding domain protein n=1 Tax=Natranaerobius thermophilus (strain ATCC BAA-1301 / DSM 18059 / JW/NM-WN-LF) TaxID=457570 RepID=B2A8H4_NATTJ|nr:4Fe-4S binding protein [Natranaerobius thermophilus]ACB85858.1 4Fe-4S ferredoxin iron-sulfur binding domain protein [Natranaerobius thermophilus JW/NM-WN-LF]